MRTPAWGGLPPPANDTEARQRLLEAAQRCIERFGVEKTAIADVAAEVGVTRRTVYRYFNSTDELLRAAFALTAGGIVGRMLAHVRRYRQPGVRLIEAMLFLMRELPADARLGPLVKPGRQRGRAEWSMFSAVTMEVSHRALLAVNEDWSPLTAREVDELAELILRLLQSFLTDPGTPVRSDTQMRAFLKRWLLPVIGCNRSAGFEEAGTQVAESDAVGTPKRFDRQPHRLVGKASRNG